MRVIAGLGPNDWSTYWLSTAFNLPDGNPLLPVVQELLHDLVQLCRADGIEPSRLLLDSAADDLTMAVLEQSIALREAGRAGLSLALLDRARAAGIGSGWLQDNRARALVVLGRCDAALAIWAELREQEADPALVACAEAAQQVAVAPQLVQALETANLIEADQCLGHWLAALVDGSGLGLRELCQVVDQQPRTFARVIPLLERRVQQHPLEAAEELLRCLQQRCAQPPSMVVFDSVQPAFLLRAAVLPQAVDLIARTRTGLWCPVSTDELVFPRQDSSNNASWFVLLRLPAGESLDQVWVNGCAVPWEIQQLQGWPYLEAVDRLLSLCRDGQVPLRSLPHVLQGCLGPALLELSQPLRDSSVWPQFIQRSQRIGRPARDAELTLVIPLYGRWEYIRGHVAGFAMDPWFQTGKVRLLYVCDDPRLHLLHRWCSMHLAHEQLDITLISLRRNMGFAMACNIGVQAAETPLVCLMNSDVMPIDPGWIDPLHQQIEMHPEQLLAPLLVYDSGLIQHAGMTTDVQDNGCRVSQPIFTPSRG